MRDAQGKIIDYASPVNWNWAGNKDLVGWWLALPGFMGGAKWRNLVGPADLSLGNHGTLKNITQGTTEGWTGTNRRGGFGAFKLGGTANHHILCGTSGQLAPTVAITKSFWINLSATGVYILMANRANGAENSGAIWFLNTTTWNFWVSLATGTWNVQATSSSGVATGTWVHLCGTYDGLTGRLYVNGQQQTSFASTGSIFYTAGHTQTLGADTNANCMNGYIDDCRIYRRALGANEVRDLYLESSQGYPRGIRRIRAFTLPGGSPAVFSAAGTSTATLRGATGSALSAAGTSTAAFVGAAGGILSSAGTSTAAFTGTSTVDAVLAIAGTSTNAFVAQVLAEDLLDVAGDSTTDFTSSLGGLGALAIAGTNSTTFTGAFATEGVLGITGNSTTNFIAQGGLTAVLTIIGTSTTNFNGKTNLRVPALIPWDEQDPRKRSRYHQQVVALLINSLIRSGGIVEDNTNVFRLGYQAANPADWALNQPSTVGEALDRIAALIGPIP